MKKFVIVVLLLSAMLFVFAGVALAQPPLPTILLSGSGDGFCEGPVEIDIQVDDVTELWGYSAVVVYDQRYVEATIEFNNDFFDTTSLDLTGLDSAVALCYLYSSDETGVCGIAASVLDSPVSSDTPRTIGTITLNAIPGAASSTVYLTPGNLDINNPPVLPFSSLNSLTYQNGFIALGPPAEVQLDGCPSALAGPLNLQGGSLAPINAPLLFAAAALLGLSGLLLAVGMRRREEQAA